MERWFLEDGHLFHSGNRFLGGQAVFTVQKTRLFRSVFLVYYHWIAGKLSRNYEASVSWFLTACPATPFIWKI